MGMHVLAYGALYVLVSLPFQVFNAYTSDASNAFAIFEPTRFVGLCGTALVLLVLQVLFMFTPLIIVDQHLSVGAALKKSFATFGPQFFPLLGVLICVGLLAMLGFVACGLGILFTLPVAYTIYGVIYNDFFRPTPVDAPEKEVGWYPRPN
jgi:uncharacterized membrane protein